MPDDTTLEPIKGHEHFHNHEHFHKPDEETSATFEDEIFEPVEIREAFPPPCHAGTHPLVHNPFAWEDEDSV